MEALQMPRIDGLMQGAQAKADQARLENLVAGADRRGEDLEGLEETAREFESVFINQLLKSMRSTVPENKLFNSKGASKFYQQMHDAELARSLAGGHQGMGFTELIVNQFAGAVARGEKADASAPDAPLVGPPAPTALARYRVFGETARAIRERGEVAALMRRALPAEADTLHTFRRDIEVAARRHDVPPALLLAVIMEESGGDPGAVSAKGARGLMQLMPATAREMGVADPTQPGSNIAGGARYLAEQLERFDGDLPLALSAYNAGPGAVERAGRAVPDYPETRRYVERVMSRFDRLAGGTDLANENQ